MLLIYSRINEQHNKLNQSMFAERFGLSMGKKVSDLSIVSNMPTIEELFH